jgi:cation diffusion facilitator CzcD-associated flavoprotein CzcO
MSGILCAIRLHEHGYDDVVIYEKAEKLGGTWRENRYPGLSCDIPSHVYCYPFAPNPDWSQKYSPGPEIQAYLERVAKQYDVTRLMQFDTEITRAEFDDGCWHLFSGERDLGRFDAVLAATGILHHPSIPHFDGLDTFAGHAFHSARWPDDLPLNDKRVGIIGTGSTAIQIVNALTPEVPELRLFQRTAQWIWPEPNASYSEDDKARFRDDPQMLAHIRQRMSEVIDARFSNALVAADSKAMEAIESECLAHLEAHVSDPELRRKLTPDYRAGCKRLIMATGFYECMAEPHVHLVTEPIRHIEPTGLRTEDGELHELDVLVLATGFNAHQFMRPMQIRGRDGVTLEDVWRDSVYAYRSIAIPEFPNFFMLMGPQSPVGNFSLIDVAEIQFRYIVQLLDMLRDECRSLSPKSSATERFTNDVIAAMKNTIWVTGCQSWYLDERGVPITWPWTVQDFADSMVAVERDDYEMS